MHTDANASVSEWFSTAAVVLGLISLVTCWWFPFGAVLGVVGTGLGVLAWSGGRPLVGTVLAAAGGGTGLLLGWDYWARVFGA
jgi:hypothetical protein